MVQEKKAKKGFTSEEVAVFCDQIAMLLNSGVPVHEGIYILYSEMEDRKTKAILEQVHESVKDGVSLHQALDETNAFPRYMVHMIRVGESTGKVEEVMRSLSSYYERDTSIKASIKNAVAYPVVLFMIMAVVLVVLVWKILPLFEGMLAELTAEVAESSKTAMDFGLAAGKVVAIVACVLVFVVFALLLWYKTEAGERKLKAFLVNFKLTRKSSQLLATGNFVASMALMMNSGIDLREALKLERDSCGNRDVQKKIGECLSLCEKDVPMDEALRDAKLIVGMEYRLVSVAAKTGAADVIFSKLGEQYNEKITISLNRISTIVETSLVVSLAVLVGAVLLAVMLPLVSIISSIG